MAKKSTWPAVRSGAQRGLCAKSFAEFKQWAKPSTVPRLLFQNPDSPGQEPPGGAFDYIINGHMIAGFGLVAWPADYGESGVMTFIINQQGKVYQKDSGQEYAIHRAKHGDYNPDSSWKLSRE